MGSLSAGISQAAGGNAADTAAVASTPSGGFLGREQAGLEPVLSPVETGPRGGVRMDMRVVRNQNRLPREWARLQPNSGMLQVGVSGHRCRPGSWNG